MNCKQIRTCFYDYTDDGLDQRTRSGIESHLSSCAACRLHYETQRRFHQSVASAAAAELAAVHFQSKPAISGSWGADRRPYMRVVVERMAPALPALLLLCLILWPILKPTPEAIDEPDQSAYAEAFHSLEMYSADRPESSSFPMPVAVIIRPGAPARVVELDGKTDISAELK